MAQSASDLHLHSGVLPMFRKGGSLQPFGEAILPKETVGQLAHRLLEPEDIVFVPRTTIVRVGQWVDQHINKVVPRTGFRYAVPVGSGTVGIDTAQR